MLQHSWSIVCARVLFDALTRTASLIDVIEGINLPPIPSSGSVKIPLQPIIVTEWILDDSVSPQFKVALVDPDGKQVNESQVFPIEKKGGERPKTVLALQDLEFKQFGDYRFVVSARDDASAQFKTFAEVPLKVVEAPNVVIPVVNNK